MHVLTRATIKIPVDLLLKLVVNGPTYQEHVVFLAILCLTWGEGRASRKISPTELAELLEKDVRGIRRAITKLMGRGMLICEAPARGSRAAMLAPEKDTRKWQSLT